MSEPLPALLRRIRDCRLCAEHLPLGPRPVLEAAPEARVMIVGQAPGTRVHETGIPWNDPSGDRLREWMGVEHDAFYDPARYAIVPMGFCYPGKGPSGDLPPRPECAATWREPLHAALPNVRLTLLIGQYAQRYYLGARRKRSLTDTVKAWREYGPQYLPMPHPSPRNVGWRQRNAWFESEVVPALRRRLAEALGKEYGR